MFKIGHVICFTKDIRAGTEKHIRDRGQVRIPAGVPCLIKRISQRTMVVEYDGKERRLINIPERMRLATEMGRVLFEP